MYVGSRILYATARDGNFVEMFSGLHSSFKTPVAGIIFQVGSKQQNRVKGRQLQLESREK